MKAICKHCGAEYDEIYGVCPHCGAAYESEPVRKAPAAQPRETGGNGRSVVPFLIGGLCLLALLTVILCFMSDAFHFGDKSAAERMPEVVGMQEEEAKAVLEALDLKVTVSYTVSSKEEGSVISQSIRADRKLTEITSVTITVSTGTESAEEPTEETAAPKATTALPESSTGLSTPEPAEPIPTPTATPSAKTYQISVICGTGGSVSPSGSVELAEGQSATFTITPKDGYEISDVKVDGTSVGTVSSYVFSDVTANHSIYAIFRVKVEETPTPTVEPTPTEAPATPIPASPTDVSSASNLISEE